MGARNDAIGRVTVSIDDGTRHDLRLADLLLLHGLRATFYVPKDGPRELTPAQLRGLDTAFEIGSHGVSHVELTTLPPDAVRSELRDSKTWLEETLGHEIQAFCYPFGRFTHEIAALVASEGYACARTCQLNRRDVPRDPYLMGMTTDACAHSRQAQLRHGIRERNLRGLLAYVSTYRLERDWEVHFTRALRVVARRGGIAHLVVHSAEIDERGDWEKLDRALGAAAATTLRPATNTEACLGIS